MPARLRPAARCGNNNADMGVMFWVGTRHQCLETGGRVIRDFELGWRSEASDARAF